MLTKQQKEFRRQMKEIKKEKGQAYYEIYDKGTPNRPWGNSRPRNHSSWIRVLLFLGLVTRFIYRSGSLTPMLKSQDALSSYTPKTPAIVKSVASPVIGDRERGCSDYLQLVRSIEEQIGYIFNNYNQGALSDFAAQEQIRKLEEEVGNIKTIKYGEALRDIVLERLQITRGFFELVEDLKMTRRISTEEEKIIWDQKNEYKEQLANRLRELAHSQQVEVKALLEKYDMRYVENKDGSIHYSYYGDENMNQ